MTLTFRNDVLTYIHKTICVGKIPSQSKVQMIAITPTVATKSWHCDKKAWHKDQKLVAGHLPQRPCFAVTSVAHVHTTPDLHITAGFVRTGSDVPSLPVMSLKMKK
jgi:hypothetical protein